MDYSSIKLLLKNFKNVIWGLFQVPFINILTIYNQMNIYWKPVNSFFTQHNQKARETGVVTSPILQFIKVKWIKINTLATWCEKPTHWKRPWCWERQKAGKGDDRGWDGWMASPTQRTWIWASSRSWWRTEKPGVLQQWGHKESGITKQLNNNNKI